MLGVLGLALLLKAATGLDLQALVERLAGQLAQGVTGTATTSSDGAGPR